ncbi:MAG: hypothetical protein SXU28_11075, partial [Pseudomonadota bacterium]|nr:hypothetical protein [Pseudomonadota bacterium]
LFDTGIGGLSVYDALSAALPDAPVIYAADYAGIEQKDGLIIFGHRSPPMAERLAGVNLRA